MHRGSSVSTAPEVKTTSRSSEMEGRIPVTDWNLSSELKAISDFLLNTCRTSISKRMTAKDESTDLALIGQSDERKRIHQSHFGRLSDVLSDSVAMRMVTEIPDEEELSLRFVDLEFIGGGNVEDSMIDRIRFRYRHDVRRESSYGSRYQLKDAERDGGGRTRFVGANHRNAPQRFDTR